MRNAAAIAALVALSCCESALAAPPPQLPPPPAPPRASQVVDPEDDAPAANDPRLPPRPRPTGDREADALTLGFWGCRVMGLRLVPTLSGRAWIRATLGPGGEVLDVVAERVESLPRPVVQCLLDRVVRARFDPRGGEGSEIRIPVDFTGARSPATPTAGSVPNMASTAPIDLANANGSTTASPLAWSNSWPKWSPFLQSYKGHQLLWIAFSSTRDYGLRVRNHVNGAGQFQCYPPDGYEQAGAAHGTQFSPQCQQPQIWMAAIDVTVASNPHNHTPQWTQRAGGQPPPDAGTCAMQGMNCTQGATCCSGLVCQATGTCGMIAR